MSEYAMNFIGIVCVFIILFGSGAGYYTAFQMDVQHQKHQEEMQALRDEIKEYKEKPFNITVTWDIPAQSIGADLPPLPVRKHKN